MKTTFILISLLIALFKPSPAKAQLAVPAFCVGAIVTGISIVIYVDAKCYTPWFAVWDKDAPGDCWCCKTSRREMRLENWGEAAGPYKKPQSCYDFLNQSTNCPPRDGVSKASEIEPDDEPEPAVPVIVEKAPTPNGPWRQVNEITASPTNDRFVLFTEKRDADQAFYRVLSGPSEL